MAKTVKAKRGRGTPTKQKQKQKEKEKGASEQEKKGKGGFESEEHAQNGAVRHSRAEFAADDDPGCGQRVLRALSKRLV